MRLPALIFAAALAALPCSATVAVIYLDEDILVVAADSRALRADNVITDDACKIGTLEGEVVFATAGTLGYRTELDAAYRTVNTRYGTIREHLREVAETFAQAASDRFAELGRLQPAEVERLIDVNGGGLLTAILVDGDFNAFQVRIGGTPHKVTWEVSPLYECSLQNFCAIGQVDTVTHTLHSGSRRLIPRAAVDRARELVELTRKDHQSEVGGPVDVIQMSRGATPVWEARKPVCRE